MLTLTTGRTRAVESPPTRVRRGQSPTDDPQREHPLAARIKGLPIRTRFSVTHGPPPYAGRGAPVLARSHAGFPTENEHNPVGSGPPASSRSPQGATRLDGGE
jgi:hypothetical protein